MSPPTDLRSHEAADRSHASAQAAGGAGFGLKSSQFRKEREKSWHDLDRIIEQVEKRGFPSLSAADLHRLPTLYRAAASSLSVARAISLDRNVLDYLEALVGRAYVVVYSRKRTPVEVLIEFLTRSFPGGVYTYWKFVAAAVLLLGLGVLCGFVLTRESPERFFSFVPAGMAQGRTPDASTEELREPLYQGNTSAGELTVFASFLFTHNAQIGIGCFALGFVAGVPTAILLFYNGLLLGAMVALYASRGLGGEFLAWVMGHGVTELAAVCLSGGAGFVLGYAVVFPESITRWANLARHGRRVAPIMVGAVLMFVAAAILEGYFRQLVHSVMIRWSVAAATLLFWALYFGALGRKRPLGDD